MEWAINSTKTIVLIWSETMKTMKRGNLMLTTPRSLVQIIQMFIYFINDFGVLLIAFAIC